MHTENHSLTVHRFETDDDHLWKSQGPSCLVSLYLIYH